RFDDDARKKAGDDKRLAEKVVPPAEQAAAAPSALARFNGTYSGALLTGGGTVHATLTVDNGRGTVTVIKSGCAPQVFPVVISPAGQVSGAGTLTCILSSGQDAQVGPATIMGGPDGERRFTLKFVTSHSSAAYAISVRRTDG
ncbi:hypothetical protein, partial [Reyranella sp.]|uniref:hypothetical protein n=1 Tax=Reyranella sp. TaxID=1929291 RepID=UPI002F91EEC4